MRLDALPVLVGGLVAGAYLFTYMTGGAGRSMSTLLADLGGRLGGTIPLTSVQQDMVRIIESEFAAAGLAYLEVAAVVNAYAESRLDPRAAGDGGNSIGLFQANMVAGVGKGYSRAQLEDPRRNTQLIIAEAKARLQSTGDDVRGMSEADRVRWFAQHVERCARCGTNPGDPTDDREQRATTYLEGLFG